MSDLFREKFPDEYLVRVAQVMQAANWHTFQVLTKRPKRMQELLRGKLNFAAQLPNIWWGVSVENNAHGLPRIELLRNSPARVRFLSVEPLLERLIHLDLTGIHWVIVGGESGPGARPCLKPWVTDIRDTCERQGVPFFFKQWGGIRPKSAGRDLDGRTHDDHPALADSKPLSVAERRLIAQRLEWRQEVAA
jgi:protein gp37